MLVYVKLLLQWWTIYLKVTFIKVEEMWHLVHHWNSFYCFEIVWFKHKSQIHDASAGAGAGVGESFQILYINMIKSCVIMLISLWYD